MRRSLYLRSPLGCMPRLGFGSNPKLRPELAIDFHGHKFWPPQNYRLNFEIEDLLQFADLIESPIAAFKISRVTKSKKNHLQTLLWFAICFLELKCFDSEVTARIDFRSEPELADRLEEQK